MEDCQKSENSEGNQAMCNVTVLSLSHTRGFLALGYVAVCGGKQMHGQVDKCLKCIIFLCIYVRTTLLLPHSPKGRWQSIKCAILNSGN